MRSATRWLLAVVLLAALLEFSRPVNHDVAWVLTIGHLMRTGHALYTDILEINPPLIFWLAYGVDALASLLHVHAETVYRVSVLLLGMGSALTVRRFTGSVWPALALLIGALVLVGPDFGQRDPLIAFLLAPYVAMTASASRPRHAWALGVLAALAVCVKPFYLGVWLLTAFRKPWGLADTAFLLTGALYLALVPVLAPGFWPLVHTYGDSYRAWLAVPWTTQAVTLTAMLGLVTVALALLVRRPLPRWGMAMALATVGCVVALIAQAKPFSYHQVPVIVFGLMTLTALVRISARVPRMLASFVALCLVAQGALLWASTAQDHPPRAAVKASLATIPDTVRIALLSQSLQHAAALFGDLHRPWLLPTPSLWWLDHRVESADSAAWDSLLTRTIEAVGAADLLLVDTSSYGMRRGMPPRIAARVHAAYRLTPVAVRPPLVGYRVH